MPRGRAWNKFSICGDQIILSGHHRLPMLRNSLKCHQCHCRNQFLILFYSTASGVVACGYDIGGLGSGCREYHECQCPKTGSRCDQCPSVRSSGGTSVCYSTSRMTPLQILQCHYVFLGRVTKNDTGDNLFSLKSRHAGVLPSPCHLQGYFYSLLWF